MAKLGINTGSIPNDGTGDTLLAAALKINQNFDEIYSTLGDGSNLSGVVTSLVGYATTEYVNSSLVGYATTELLDSVVSSIPTFDQDLSTVNDVTFNRLGITTGEINVGYNNSLLINVDDAESGVSTYTFDTVGNLTIPGNIYIDGNSGYVLFNNGGSKIQAEPTNDFEIHVGGFNNKVTGFGTDGSLTVPGTITLANGLKLADSGSGLPGNFGFIGDETTDVLYLQGQNGVVLTFPDGLDEPDSFLFDASGITFPDSTVQTTAYTGGGGSSSQWETTAAGIHTLSNVGIGTTNVTSKLTVKGDTSLETLNVSGVSTFAGITTVTGQTLFSKQLNVSGVSTFSRVEIPTATSVPFIENIQNKLIFGNDLNILSTSSNNYIVADENPLSIGVVVEDGGPVNESFFGLVNIYPSNDVYYGNDSYVTLGFGVGNTKLQTLGTGVTVTGTTFTNQLSVSGVVTATTFVGNFSGSITDATNLTGGYANASSLNVSGIATISAGRIQADAGSNLRFGNLPAGSGSGRNIAIGDQVLASLSGGSGRNIGIGELSYYDTTTGQYNIGIGERAGQKVTTGAYNVILGAYDGNSGNLDIRTSSNNIVIADGQGNIRQYINSSGNVGIKTTVVTEALTVAGIVSATSFYGTLNAGQLTGALPAIDGSALIGVVGSGSGVIVQDDATPVGTAGTINFGPNLSVSFASGTATVSGASSVSAATTAYALAGTPNVSLGNVTAGITTLRTSTLDVLNSNGVDFENAFVQFSNAGWIGWRRVGSLGQGRLEVFSGFDDANINLRSSSNIILENFDGSQTYAGFSTASLYLNHNNSKKFETTGYGVSVYGNVYAPTGIITASSFSGSGANLTSLPAGQLTGALPAIDGSALINVTASGTGIVVEDDNVNVGSAVTVNFGTGLDVTFNAGIATITASGGSLQSRTTVTGVTTSIANNGIGNTNITGFKSYALMKVGLSTAGWLRLYTDSTSRANDASRSVGVDPAPGSGVIAEVVTTGISTTQIISPFVMGGNLDNPADTTIYAAITNLSGSTQAITANLTILQLEA